MKKYPLENLELVDSSFLKKLKFCGKNVRIYARAQLIKPKAISIGDHSQIDDFVWILGGQGVKIGKRCHISALVSVAGGGRFEMEDYAVLSCGCRIITGSDDLSEGKALISAAVPLQYRSVIRSFVKVCRFGILATNVIIFPGVTIGEGAIIGAGSIVTHDVEPWGIYYGVGANFKKIRTRPKDVVISLAHKLEQEEL